MPTAARLLLALALAACLAGAQAAGRRQLAEPEIEPEAGSGDNCPAGYTVVGQGEVPEELLDATLAEFFGSGLAANTTTFASCANGTSWTIQAAGCAKEGETLVGVLMGCRGEPGQLLVATLNTAGAAPKVTSLKAAQPGDLASGDYSVGGISIDAGSSLFIGSLINLIVLCVQYC